MVPKGTLFQTSKLKSGFCARAVVNDKIEINIKRVNFFIFVNMLNRLLIKRYDFLVKNNRKLKLEFYSFINFLLIEILLF